MHESLLHFIWLKGSFDQKNLLTTDNQEIVIVNQGKTHMDGGPDFQHASLHIEDQLWVGDVEIHVDSSEWFAHGHHNDKAYDSVILHVCYTCNKRIVRSNGSEIPCLELKGKISSDVLKRYEDLQLAHADIPCSGLISDVDSAVKALTLEHMMGRKVQQTSDQIIQSVEERGIDWPTILYQRICRSFGLRINKDPFHMLSQLIPFGLVLKYSDKIEYLEALIFGTAGFLAKNGRDEYESRLIIHYDFLQRKHQLDQMEVHLWKFLRLRPANFPTVRLAQLASFLTKSPNLFSTCLEMTNVKKALEFFTSGTSSYWQNHFRFGRMSVHQNKTLGKDTINLILINAVVPVLLAYAQWKKDDDLTERVIHLFNQIDGENNKLTRKYKSLGFPVRSASSTQGIVFLAENFCTFKRCLECPIGQNILR